MVSCCSSLVLRIVTLGLFFELLNLSYAALLISLFIPSKRSVGIGSVLATEMASVSNFVGLGIDLQAQKRDQQKVHMYPTDACSSRGLALVRKGIGSLIKNALIIYLRIHINETRPPLN